MRSVGRQILFILACSVSVALSLGAQDFGRIVGVATDSSGAVIPGVSVHVINNQTIQRPPTLPMTKAALPLKTYRLDRTALKLRPKDLSALSRRELLFVWATSWNSRWSCSSALQQSL